MTVTWSYAPTPSKFGLIRTALTEAELIEAFRQVDRLKMRISTLTFSSARPTEVKRDSTGSVTSTLMRTDDDDSIEHRAWVSADTRDETPTHIVVSSQSALRDVRVSIRIARCMADHLMPNATESDKPMIAAVALMSDALEEAAVQAGSHPDIRPKRPDQSLIQGAGLTLAPELDLPANGSVMATGPSRITPGLIRVGRSGAMRDVDPGRVHAASIPAWSRLDGLCHDGEDGARPMIFVELGELRMQRSIDGITMPDRMRAIARWADVGGGTRG